MKGRSDSPVAQRAGLALPLLLAAVTLAAMWPLTTFDFVRWDDPHNLAENPDMTPPTLKSVAKYWDPRRPYKDLYIPFTYTVWAGLAAIAYAPGADGGTLTPAVFHTANVVLHVMSGWVVFVILLRLMGKRWAAWVGAALFAVHPVQVEPVGWVSGMKDVLSGLLSLVAIWLYIEHAQRAPGRKAWAMFAGATAAFGLAMLSKPSAVVVPLIVGVIDLGLLGRPVRRVTALVVPWLVMALAVAVVARGAQPADRLDFVPPVWGRPIVALDALAFYLKQVVFPIRLGIDYGRSPEWLWKSSAKYYTWLAPAAVIVVLIVFRKRLRVAGVAAAIFGLGVLPVLGLVPFDFQAFSTVADHYLYLAMLGPALFVAWVVAMSRGRMVAPLAGLLLAGLLVRAHMQTWSWQSSRELFAHTLRVNYRSIVGNVNLANLLSREAVGAMGRRDFSEAAAKLETARHYYQLALTIEPDDVQALTGLGNLYVLLGQPERAIPLYVEAMKQEPGSAELHANLGRAHMVRRDYEAALVELREALRLAPEHPTATVDLQTTLKRSGMASPASLPTSDQR